jgi:hypothetical protein
MEGSQALVMLLVRELGVYVSNSPADFPLVEKRSVQAVCPLVPEFRGVEIRGEPAIA